MLSCMQKKVKLESNSPQKSMWIICTQKKVNIKSNTVQNTCMQKKVEIKSNTIQNTMVITCMKKKVKIKSNSIHNIMMLTCRQKKVNIESNSPSPLCLHPTPVNKGQYRWKNRSVQWIWCTEHSIEMKLSLTDQSFDPNSFGNGTMSWVKLTEIIC